MFELLKESVDFQALNRPANIEYHRVFDTVKETNAHHFLHGVAVEQWQNRLAVCFAYNAFAENSETEELLIRWSNDDGKTWTQTEHIVPPADCAHSHSVFLPQSGSLWCLGPRFHGLGEKPVSKKGYPLIHFVGLQMEAWKLVEDMWKPMGIVADDFWPLGAPTKMDNGNWLISGCDENWYAAIAISHGNDLTRWDVVKPDTDGEVFTEAGAWVNGNKVCMVMRNQSLLIDGKYPAAVAFSDDDGRTFGECMPTDLPIATTKPFCGRLSDGRIYLVFNESIPGKPNARDRMLIGIGDGKDFKLDHFYVVDEGYATPTRRLSLSYPYAKEIEGRLYITYSYESTPGTGSNHNDAMLAIIRLEDL